MAKKASKKASAPAVAKADPRPVLATRAHYRQAAVRLVRRQLDCARSGLIGTDKWFRAFSEDFSKIRRYARWARFHAPHVERFDEPPEMASAGVMFYPGRNDWVIEDGIPVHSISPLHDATRQHVTIEGEMQDPDVLAALNLAATHVLSEWLEWIETAQEQDLETDMMPPAYFEPIKTANADNLRKWRDAGKIVGAKSGRGREVLYSVTSVLRHLRLPASTRDALDRKWLDTYLTENYESPAEVRRRIGEAAEAPVCLPQNGSRPRNGKSRT
jgi:hypothetical protein